MKHTPEPWNVGPEGTTSVEIEAQGEVIGYFWLPEGSNNADCPNADHAVECVNACKDINPEAVPDLLNALRMLTSALRDCPDFKDFATTEDGVSIQPIAIARAAIAKATKPQ